MQNLSRDDFAILNGVDVAVHSLEKEMCPTIIYRIQNNLSLNLPKIYTNEDNPTQNCVDVKLEDINSIDLFPSHSSTWQQNPVSITDDLNSHQMLPHKCFAHANTNLLLQGSDGPLISHGTNNVLTMDDEHSTDFAKSLILQSNNYRHHEISDQKTQIKLRKFSGQQLTSHHRPIKSGCSNFTKQQLKVKANLMSVQNQEKQNQSNTSISNEIIIPTATNQKHQCALSKTEKKKSNMVKLRFHHQALPAEYLSHYEATQGLQRLCKNQQKANMSLQRTSSRTVNHSQNQTQPRNSNENVRSWLQKIPEIQRTANASNEKNVQNQKPSKKLPSQTNKTSKITTEPNVITNSLSSDDNTNTQSQNTYELPYTLSTNLKAVHDVDCFLNVKNNSNRMQTFYTDLPYMGEITLDNYKPRRGRKPKKADIYHLMYKNYGTILPKILKPEIRIENQKHKIFKYEQPLNLCLRDQLLNDSYSISSSEELSKSNSSCPKPVNSPTDCMRDAMLANSLKTSLNDLGDIQQENTITDPAGKTFALEKRNNLIKLITIYYQKLFQSGMPLKNSNGSFKTTQKDNQLALKIPIPNDLLFSQKLHKTLSSSISPITEYSEPLLTPSTKSENSLPYILTCEHLQPSAPQKRKRSAIFIPPTNIENTANPATEVSICKFKFTGGSKPTLQEKKMISVDAGGNYRYFSGTPRLVED